MLGVDMDVKALMVISGERDDIEATFVRKVAGENDINASVSPGGL